MQSQVMNSAEEVEDLSDRHHYFRKGHYYKHGESDNEDFQECPVREPLLKTASSASHNRREQQLQFG